MFPDYTAIQKSAEACGLMVRGGFIAGADDEVPDVAVGGEQVTDVTLIMFGNAGSSLWPAFSCSPEFSDGEPDPMNRWSERIGNDLAEQWGGAAYFPFGGPPYQPFLMWAKKAESLDNSRLGMLIHPKYGLWHAYRFAIALPCRISGFESVDSNSTDAADICAQCVDQPCLQSCPVDAFSDQGYDVESCFRFLESKPDSKCMTHTCAARLACPEGNAFVYEPTHARFHMAAFYASVKVRFGV